MKELERFLTFYYPFLPGALYSAAIFIVAILIVRISFDIDVLVFQLALAYTGFALWMSTYFQLMWFTDLGLEEGQKELGIADNMLNQVCKEERMALRFSAAKQVGMGLILSVTMCGLVYKITELGFATPQKAYQSTLWLIFWGTIPSSVFMYHQAKKYL